jgi:nucleotide-binding universal stress UspA family protein
MADNNFYIQNILVAIDGSEHSLAAVNLLSDLPIKKHPTGTKCRITALGVLPPRDASSHSTYLIPLRQAQKILQSKRHQVVTELICGYPAEIITSYAETHSSDLVIVGAKGLRATLGILLGGVAQQVIEYSSCPVLVVRAPYVGIRNVLLVTDGSESSIAATKYIANFPLHKSVKIFIVHVLPPEPILKAENIMKTWSITDEAIQDYPSISKEELLLKQAQEQEIGRGILQKSSEILESYHRPSQNILLRGDAATEIITYSIENHIDIIIAGSRGFSQFRSWLLGSVSRKLVHYAHCSVLLVKNPRNPSEIEQET